MAEADAEVTANLLAKGLTEIFVRIDSEGVAVHQDASMPPVARRALARLSRHCLESGAADLGASIHVVMDKACEAMGEWGVAAFRPPFRFADVTLVDRGMGVPTDDCREMALQGGSEAAILEEIHHERLRDAVSRYPAADRDLAYTAIRGFVVRNPAIEEAALNAFILTGGFVASARTIAEFYRPVPQAAAFGAVARRCAHCGSLLWPDRDRATYPFGRCRIRQCRLAHPTPAMRDEIADPTSWRVGTNAVLAYWVGPGLDEITIHDALEAAGRKVALYPLADAVDVGVDGLDIGIDVKTYASPLVLGARLTRSIGRLGLFDRRILAVPDDKLTINRDYLVQLRESYQGPVPLEFKTVSATIRELSR